MAAVFSSFRCAPARRTFVPLGCLFLSLFLPGAVWAQGHNVVTNLTTGDTSEFTIDVQATLPAPVLQSISQNSVTTPSGSFTFTSISTGFVSDTTLLVSEEYGAAGMTTQDIDATNLQITFPALNAVSQAVNMHLFVANTPVLRSNAANDLLFTINPPAMPTLTSLSQNSVTTPNAAFNLTVTGTNFIPNTTLLVSEEFGTAGLQTQVIDSTHLQVTFPALNAFSQIATLHLFVASAPGIRSAQATDLPFTLTPPPVTATINVINSASSPTHFAFASIPGVRSGTSVTWINQSGGRTVSCGMRSRLPVRLLRAPTFRYSRPVRPRRSG